MTKLFKTILVVYFALLVSACQTIPPRQVLTGKSSPDQNSQWDKISNQTIPPGWVLTGKSSPGQNPQWNRISNLSRIKVVGTTATLTTVESYSTPQETDKFKNGYTSITYTNEHKCGERLSRFIDYKSYEGSNGVLVSSNNTPGQYQTIEPGTVGETEYNIACKDVRVSPPVSRPQPVQPTPQQKPQPQDPLDIACMRAIRQKHEYSYKDKYGNLQESRVFLGRTVRVVGHHKYGAQNTATYFVIIVDRIVDGRPQSGRAKLNSWCVSNPAGQIIGIELDL
jgi:hypothetical protein